MKKTMGTPKNILFKGTFNFCAFADEAANGLGGQITALNENGIALLEIRGVDGENISTVTAVKAREIRNTLDAAGIGVWSIGSPTGKINISDGFGPHFDQFKHMLELAGILGASRYRLFSFYGCEGEADRAAVMERLTRFVEEAEGSGVVLCHENEAAIYGEMADGCLDIHKSVPGLKAVFDPANFVLAGQGIIPAWELLEPYVDYIHLKDAKFIGEVTPAGFGDGEIPEILRRFKKIGGGVLSVEPHLTVFDGRAELERGAVRNAAAFEYPSRRAAFDAAVEALKKIIVDGGL